MDLGGASRLPGRSAQSRAYLAESRSATPLPTRTSSVSSSESSSFEMGKTSRLSREKTQPRENGGYVSPVHRLTYPPIGRDAPGSALNRLTYPPIGGNAPGSALNRLTYPPIYANSLWYLYKEEELSEL